MCIGGMSSGYGRLPGGHPPLQASMPGVLLLFVFTSHVVERWRAASNGAEALGSALRGGQRAGRGGGECKEEGAQASSSEASAKARRRAASCMLARQLARAEGGISSQRAGQLSGRRTVPPAQLGGGWRSRTALLFGRSSAASGVARSSCRARSIAILNQMLSYFRHPSKQSAASLDKQSLGARIGRKETQPRGLVL
jgi:hypothetical protein